MESSQDRICIYCLAQGVDGTLAMDYWLPVCDRCKALDKHMRCLICGHKLQPPSRGIFCEEGEGCRKREWFGSRRTKASTTRQGP